MTDMLEQLMTVWDRLPAAEAVARAWMEPSPAHGTWHRHARRDVADLMPLLARALDRLLAELEEKLPAPDPALWEELPRLARVACRDVSCRCGHLHVRHARGGRCRARDCRCSVFSCSCAGRRDCAS